MSREAGPTSHIPTLDNSHPATEALSVHITPNYITNRFTDEINCVAMKSYHEKPARTQVRGRMQCPGFPCVTLHVTPAQTGLKSQTRLSIHDTKSRLNVCDVING